MKKFLLLAVLAVSASAFAANAADLVGELQALDAEYQNLASQEEARFNEERAQADAARQALAQNEQVYNELSQRAIQKQLSLSKQRILVIIGKMEALWHLKKQV